MKRRSLAYATMSPAGIRSLASILKAAGMAISSPCPKQFSVPLAGVLSSSCVLELELSQGNAAASPEKTC